MSDLPPGFRQAYEMGLLSSAQLVRYLSINAFATKERMISRALPQGLSEAFMGRMMANPRFFKTLYFELAATVGSSVWWEVKNRKNRLKEEWDLALINVVTVSACKAAAVWLVAPCRPYGNTFRFDVLNKPQKLPNNVFEKSYPLRVFDLQKRIHSLLYKTAELSIVGLGTGALQCSLSNFLAGKKENRVSVKMPSTSTNVVGYGAFLGIYANLRYQLLYGFDILVIKHSNDMRVALPFIDAVRIMNALLLERSRQEWLGVDPLAHSDELLPKAYIRPTEETVAGKPSSKARRKRIVSNKVAAS